MTEELKASKKEQQRLKADHGKVVQKLRDLETEVYFRAPASTRCMEEAKSFVNGYLNTHTNSCRIAMST